MARNLYAVALTGRTLYVVALTGLLVTVDQHHRHDEDDSMSVSQIWNGGKPLPEISQAAVKELNLVDCGVMDPTSIECLYTKQPKSNDFRKVRQ
jgi:hypothetical protein